MQAKFPIFAAFQFSELTKQSLERQREKTLTTSLITSIFHKHLIQFFAPISKSHGTVISVLSFFLLYYRPELVRAKHSIYGSCILYVEL